jgi:hypothetical protein
VSDARHVTITLTDAQIASVVHVASGGGSLAALLGDVSNRNLHELHDALLPLLDDESYSRSVFRALLLLSAFPADGGERELTDLAEQVGLSASTTHRYLRTWVAVGLLEQAPSRRYRRPSAMRTAAPGTGSDCVDDDAGGRLDARTW